MNLEIAVERVDIPDDAAAVARELRDRAAVTPADEVRRGLALFNIEHPGQLHAPLNVFLREPTSGRTEGGLVGRTGRGGLYIEHMWIAKAHRRAGHGTRLLRHAENEAQARGCGFAFVDTYRFQTPAFYERSGYVSFGRLEGFSGGASRIYFKKSLRLDED